MSAHVNAGKNNNKQKIILNYFCSEVDIGRTRVTNTTSGLDRTHSGDTESGMAWQLTAGLGVPIDDSKTLDTSYKYVDAGSTTVSGNFGPGAIPFNGVEGDMTYHEISVGIRF